MSITQRALRGTGPAKLVSFYRYFAFNVPRFVTGSAVVLLLGFAVIQLWLLFAGYDVPVYLTAYLALLAAGALLAAAGLLAAWAVGSRDAGVRRGGGPAWVLGSTVSLVSIGMYLFSRTAGLPGLPEWVGRWDFVLGTLSMGLAGAFAGLHFSVLTGMNVAAPGRRDWRERLEGTAAT